MRDPQLVDELVDELEHGHAVLVATFAGALLGLLVANLRSAGVPYRNLSAPRRPVSPAGEGLARYLVLDEREQPAASRVWTGSDVRAWWRLCQPPRGGLRREVRHLVDALPADRAVPFELLADLWTDDEQRSWALDPDPAWLLAAAKPGYRAQLRYLVSVAERNGVAVLGEAPRLLVGTVHTTGHLTVDTTYLAPDLTPAQADEWWSGNRRRLTQLVQACAARTRREVVQLAPATRYALPDTMTMIERGPR